VRTNNIYLNGEHEVYIVANLNSKNRLNPLGGAHGPNSKMTERKSPNFKIQVNDPCQPYSCAAMEFTPSTATPSDMTVDIGQGKTYSSEFAPWPNTIH
jgi:hypothetical protein